MALFLSENNIFTQFWRLLLLVDPHLTSSWDNKHCLCFGLVSTITNRGVGLLPIPLLTGEVYSHPSSSSAASGLRCERRWAARAAQWKAMITFSSSFWLETAMWAKERSWTACRMDRPSPHTPTVVVSHSGLSWLGPVGSILPSCDDDHHLVLCHACSSQKSWTYYLYILCVDWRIHNELSDTHMEANEIFMTVCALLLK